MEVAIEKLEDYDIEFVVGGNTAYYPNNTLLAALDLRELVKRDTGFFALDEYFETYRGDGKWKQVGSEDMVAYVGRTVGKNDPRYKALKEGCDTGHCVYKGVFLEFCPNRR